MNAFLYISLAVGTATLLYSFAVSKWLNNKNPGTPEMQAVAQAIATGAHAFLKAEYKVMAIFVLLSALPLAYLGLYTIPMVPGMALTYLLGAFSSALAGYIGIITATCANVRTAQAARTNLWQAFRIAFSAGSVMGMIVTGLVLLSITTIFFISFYLKGQGASGLDLAIQLCLGFALGSQIYALFARVAGGIYTKSADIGADMVGKLETGLPEDDMRNPATIADNVGDNVGDTAGSGADIFSSLTAVIVGSLGISTCFSPALWRPTLLLPAVVTAFYLLKLVLSHVILTLYKPTTYNRRLKAGRMLLISLALPGLIISVLLAGRSFYHAFFAKSMMMDRTTLLIIVGMLLSIVVSLLTMYFTKQGKRPVNFIIEQSTAGAGNNLIAGLSVGMLSAVATSVVFIMAIWFSYRINSLEGIAILAVSVLSGAVMYLTVDAFGPIADNAGGIVEMAGLEDKEKTREHTDVLDIAGNTTAASGKGFSMAAAAMATILLFAVYTRVIGKVDLSLSDPYLLLGMLLGAGVPYLFSAITISAVGKASLAMVDEVRRQFKDIPGLLKGNALPDYARCITIATHAALDQMWLPGILSIGLPIAIGLLAGSKILGAYVIGVTLSGILLGIFQCNAGGAWDNAKKAFEKGVYVGGDFLTKKSPAYHAAVVGDTVGDPLKDTSGPSINILIKLTAIIALIIAPYLS